MNELKPCPFCVVSQQSEFLKEKTVGETDMQYYAAMTKAVVELKADYIIMKLKRLKPGTEEPKPKTKCGNVKET